MSTASNTLVGLLGVAAIGGAVIQGNKPPTDVNVINTPNVNVANSPTVNVGNTPTVIVQDDREPVAFDYEGSSGALSYGHPEADLYQVPAGKRLHLTFVSAIGSTGSGIELSFLSITAGTSSSSYRARHFLNLPRPTIVNSDSRVNVSVSQEMDLVVESEERVGLQVGRTSGFVGSPSAIFAVHFSGYLTDAP